MLIQQVGTPTQRVHARPPPQEPRSPQGLKEVAGTNPSPQRARDPEAASVSPSGKRGFAHGSSRLLRFPGTRWQCSPGTPGGRLQLPTHPGAGGWGRLCSPFPAPIPSSNSPSQEGTPEKANVASAAPLGHLLPRSRHSRLPRPPPPACPGPRWGPTLRARAPQGPRDDGKRRRSRRQPAPGGRWRR